MIYSVHLRDNGKKSDLAVVPDGFSWGAAAFGFMWALYIGAWDAALMLFGLQLLANALIPLLFADLGVQGAVQVGMALLIGFGANELRRELLALRGLHEVGVVTGASNEDAERRYFDEHPDLTAHLLEAVR
ncbi:MAG: DUF2628 domain-containing protein [Rhodospirillales bacterium]|nr:DUF2628 domain-containing protein [Rhodospirillales bacterium]